MLRAIVLALLLANLTFFAWTQGWLASIAGPHPQGDREPERMARQVRPETITLLSPTGASQPAATATTSKLSCLEAGPFSDVMVVSAQATLQRAGIPAEAWTDLKSEEPGAWIIYMGKFVDRDVLTKKADELRHRQIKFEELNNAPSLEPGLSLGRFGDAAAAAKALERLAQQGVRTAKVVELTAPKSTHVLHVEKADSALAAKLTSLNDGLYGKGFSACTTSPSP